MNNNDWANKPGFDREKEEYLDLDLEQWLKECKIIEEGHKRGKDNLLSTDDNKLDTCEERIRNWINRRGRICRENVGGHLGDLDRQLGDMENEQELENLEQKVTEIENEARTEIELKAKKGHNRLNEPATAVREGSTDFEQFRKKAGLTRVADYSRRKAAIWIIMACFVVESALNATLLMEVNAFGLLGSIGQMGLISGVNILMLALAMGALCRQSNHVSSIRKSLCWAGIGLLILLDFAFNILVGHFRDSMQEILNDYSADFMGLSEDALQRMKESPLGLESFQSFLLALLGFLAFALTSWKWYQYDDPYPGYGQRDRQLKGYKAEYRKSYEEVQDDLEKLFNDYKSQLDDKRHEVEVKQSSWRDISRRGRRIVENYRVNLAQYQGNLDYLLSAYREANKATRTEPSPQHFSEPVHVDPEILEPPSFNPPGETNIKGVANTVHDAITRVQRTFQDASRQFQTLENIV